MSGWKDILYSFYSRDFYFRLAHEEQGIGLRFITALTLLSLVICMLAYPMVHAWMQAAPAYMETLPQVTIKDSKLSIDKPMPYILKIPQNDPNAATLIVDTNYKIPDIDTLTEYMHKNNAVVLFTADKVVSRKHENELQVTDLASQNIHDMVITHADWKNYAEKMARWGVALVVASIVVFGGLGVFIYHLVATVITGLVVKLLSVVMMGNLGLGTSIRLASAARVPPILLGTIFIWTGHPLAMLQWLLWIAYLIFAVHSNKRMTESSPW